MATLTLKVRLAVLWVFEAVATTAWTLLSLVVPDVIKEIMAGSWEGMPVSEGFLIFFSLFWLVPLIMAVLSVSLKDAANRWTNVVLGIIFAVFYVFHLIGHIVEGRTAFLGFLLFGSAVCIAVPALIAWYAWRWPRQHEAVT
jgi:hypothetical protein